MYFTVLLVSFLWCISMNSWVYFALCWTAFHFTLYLRFRSLFPFSVYIIGLWACFRWNSNYCRRFCEKMEGDLGAYIKFVSPPRSHLLTELHSNSPRQYANSYVQDESLFCQTSNLQQCIDYLDKVFSNCILVLTYYYRIHCTSMY